MRKGVKNYRYPFDSRGPFSTGCLHDLAQHQPPAHTIPRAFLPILPMVKTNTEPKARFPCIGMYPGTCGKRPDFINHW
jgi:hypothetical protein